MLTDCEAAGVRISITLSRKQVDCLLRVGNKSLPQMKEFKYLRVLYASEGTMGTERLAEESEQQVRYCVRFTAPL